MLQSDPDVWERAAALADEVVAGVREGRPAEWLEEVLGSALLDAMRRERERCAAIADGRAELWLANEERMSSGAWPASAAADARERRKEALVIADALRADVPLPPPV
uniref:Uncharacterized protein n=1 Tax=uncultured bacterium AB_1383 TaxID=1630010 RepID=A0A0E3JHV0_9BACT|nr:hypothetical protein [uncultured bacterium AB_1383]